MSTTIKKKNFDFTQTWKYNTKLHEPNKVDVVSFSKQWYLLNGMKVPLCFHFYFLFRTNDKKEHFAENNFHHCYGNYLQYFFWKFCWKFFPKNYKTN